MANSSTQKKTPIARTPLTGAPVEVIDGKEYQQGAESAPVLVTDLSMTRKTQYKKIRGQKPSLPVGFGETHWDGPRLTVGSAPGEWLVIEPAKAGAPADIPGTRQMDLTQGRAMMRVSGEHALELMRRVSAFNFDDRLFPDQAAVRTSVAGVMTDIIRDDCCGHPGFILHVERSSGQYLQQMLLEVGATFGAAIGQASPDFGPAAKQANTKK